MIGITVFAKVIEDAGEFMHSSSDSFRNTKSSPHTPVVGPKGIKLYAKA